MSLKINIATSDGDKSICDQIVINNHSYVASAKTVGRVIKYIIRYENDIVGTFWIGSGFKPTPKSILDYFNKSQSQFDDIFNSVADNKRFCMIKSIPNLGSQILKGIRNRAKQDWYDKYDDDLLAIVTTIGADKKGSVYLADNWEFIGLTAGLPKERKSFSFKWDQGKEHLKTETGWIDGKDRKRIFITSKLKDKILRPTLEGFFE